MNKRMYFLLTLVLLTGITIQTIRAVDLTGLFPVNQKDVDAWTELVPVTLLPAPEEYLQIFVLYSNEDEGSRQLKSNLYHTIGMAKLNAIFVNVDADGVSDIIDGIGQQDLLVIATEQLNKLHNYASIIDFTSEGGKTVFLIRSLFSPFDEMSGIAFNRGFKPQGLRGIKFHQNIFPGMDELILDNFIHSALDLDLQAKVRLLATCVDNKPLIWTNTFGDGEVLYVNSTMMKSKTMRGLMLQCLSYLPDYFITTIFNAAVFNIDDFPAPIKLGKHPQIYDDYLMAVPDFFKRVWWPDTYNFARRHNLRLTGLTIVTFNEDTRSPLTPISEIEQRQMTYFGRRLSEIGGELGIHGYNHQSLTLEGQMLHEKYGYSPWESLSAMEEGLSILKNSLREMFGEISIFTYVPPSNIISREGRLAVKNVFENVRVFAGIYTGDDEPGLLVQEFGRDPYMPEVVSFPRISSGYLYSEDLMWSVYNGLAHFGLVHHFIHPDDLFCPQRSGGLSWEEMDRQINAIFSEIRSYFPFLRPMTAFESYQYFIQMENLQVYVHADCDKINLQYNLDSFPVYHFLRLRDQRVVKVEGGSFRLVCRQNNLYLIQGRQAHVVIIIR